MNEGLVKSWPALIVGLIVGTYWLRVLQMVRKTKREAGHHANLIPEEKLGRLLRVLWSPVIVFWFVLPMLSAFGILWQFPPLYPLFDSVIAQWAALLVAIVAFILTWICWHNMGKNWRMGIDPKEKTQLVLSGPFAYVRNPIYGLSQLMMIMTVLIVPSPAMIVLAMLHILLMQWEVRREETYLLSAHGPPYAEYLRNVGRFLPRSLRAYRP
jgi:protein-S-isoprenylcysteine O-methyltransferase Ste14